MIHFGHMKRPIVIILVAGILLGGLGGGAYLFFSRTGGTKTPNLIAANPTPTPVPTLISWDDPAGFSIKYPDTLTLNKHDEDKENYAHLEFTHPSHPGSVVVLVKDLPKGVTDTISWGKKASTPSSAISFDTVINEKPAQKILVSSPVKTVTTGIVYDGVLWYIEATLTDDAFWQPIYDGMLNDFTFTPLTGSGSESDSGAGVPASGDAASYDEEEVLE